MGGTEFCMTSLLLLLLQLQQELLWRQQERTYHDHQLDVMRQSLLTQKDHTEALQKESDDKEANRRAEKREEKLDRVRTSLILCQPVKMPIPFL